MPKPLTPTPWASALCFPAAGIEVEATYRAALAREVRHDAAARNFTTFVVEVEEQGDSWSLSVPDIPGIQARVNKRQDISPAATASIASAWRFPTTSSSCTSASAAET
jgi:hypothetical protein